MVLCWIALPVFAILGIFSVKYRRLTLDSLDCIFRTATFRKCSSGLDDRIKSDVTGTFLKFSPPLAGFFYKYYKILSWIILALFILSFYFGAVGITNYVRYGNCNGPDSDGFCIFGAVSPDNTAKLAEHLGMDKEKLEGCLSAENHSSEECPAHCENQTK